MGCCRVYRFIGVRVWGLEVLGKVFTLRLHAGRMRFF